MTTRAPTPTELLLLSVFVLVVAAPFADGIVEMASVHHDWSPALWSLCTLVMSAVCKLNLIVLFVWTFMAFCVTVV